MKRQDFQEIVLRLASGCSPVLEADTPIGSVRRRFVPEARLIILGGGHVGRQLCRFASQLGFCVTVADDRPEFANAERFPEAKHIVCDSFDFALERIKPGAADYICVLTRGHRYDALCVRSILSGTMPQYIGMIGSKRRVADFREVLNTEGFAEERIAKLHAPIGIPIGAQTPAEIAISICAELIEVRQSAKQDTGCLSQTDAEEAVLRYIAYAPEPKAVLLVLDSSGSTPVKSGAMMAVSRTGTGYGTIGGGSGEAEAMRRAQALVGSDNGELIEIDMSNEVAAEEGMVCGGSMRVYIKGII